jgi:uncharacterized protein with HEPN domain
MKPNILKRWVSQSSTQPTNFARYSQIQWGRIIGMRNRIVRAYFDIGMEVVWQTITKDIPTLISQLEAVFRAEGIEL